MLDMEKAEKVKKALRICAKGEPCDGEDCPYYGNECCSNDTAREALEVIEEMEKALKMFVPLEDGNGQ